MYNKTIYFISIKGCKSKTSKIDTAGIKQSRLSSAYHCYTFSGVQYKYFLLKINTFFC